MYGQKDVDGGSKWGAGTRDGVMVRDDREMEGVMVALGNRGMTEEAARQYENDQKGWRALVHM